MISADKLANFGSTNASAMRAASQTAVGFDLEGYLESAGLEVLSRKPWHAHPGGMIYELSRCPFDPNHTDGSAAFTLLDGKPGFACKHNGCIGKSIQDAFHRHPPPQRGLKTNRTQGLLVTRRLADITPKPINWLWPGRIARGKVSIIAGNPGLGKSQITASIASVATTGGSWPVDGQLAERGGVIFLTAEDDAGDTLRPRLEAAGANLDLIHVVDGVRTGFTGNGVEGHRHFSLEEDLAALENKLMEIGNVAAVIVDPLSAYLGKTDSHKNAEVRALLAPLGDLAARHNVAIIGVSHLNKASGSQALMRVTGSLAFVAAARAAYLVAADPQVKSRRLFLPMKNNIGPDGEGLAYRIESAIVPSPAGEVHTSHVVWEAEPVTMTADEAMRTENTPDNASALSEAKDWLREKLADGPLPVAKVRTMAADYGIASRTLRRASEDLSIDKAKASMSGGWVWALPAKVSNSPEYVHDNDLVTFGPPWSPSADGSEIAEVEL